MHKATTVLMCCFILIILTVITGGADSQDISRSETPLILTITCVTCHPTHVDIESVEKDLMDSGEISCFRCHEPATNRAHHETGIIHATTAEGGVICHVCHE